MSDMDSKKSKKMNRINYNQNNGKNEPYKKNNLEMNHTKQKKKKK